MNTKIHKNVSDSLFVDFSRLKEKKGFYNTILKFQDGNSFSMTAKVWRNAKCDFTIDDYRSHI